MHPKLRNNEAGTTPPTMEEQHYLVVTLGKGAFSICHLRNRPHVSWHRQRDESENENGQNNRQKSSLMVLERIQTLAYFFPWLSRTSARRQSWTCDFSKTDVKYKMEILLMPSISYMRWCLMRRHKKTPALKSFALDNRTKKHLAQNHRPQQLSRPHCHRQ